MTLSEGSEMDCNMIMVGFWDGSGHCWSNGRKVNLQAHLRSHAGSRQAQGAPHVHTRSFSSSCANLGDSYAPVWAQGKRRLKQRNDGPTSCVKTALERIYLLLLRPSLVICQECDVLVCINWRTLHVAGGVAACKVRNLACARMCCWMARAPCGSRGKTPKICHADNFLSYGDACKDLP